MTRTPNRRCERLLAGLLVTALLMSSLLMAQAKTRLLKPTVDTPQLTSPPDFAHTTGNPDDPNTSRLLYEPLGIPTFEWQDVGASKYKLEVATTQDFGESVIVLRLDNLQYPTYTPNGEGEFSPGFGLTGGAGVGFTDEAVFYWRVHAWDDALLEWSSPSSYRQFTRHWGYQPTLRSPDHVSTQDLTSYFEWDPVPGASFYQIQVDTSSSFGSPLISQRTDVPVYTPIDALENDDDLFWRVRAFHRPNQQDFLNGGYGGPWSEVRQFKLAWSSKIDTDDKRPLQLTPPHNANYINRPIYCWQPVAGAKKYEIDVSSHPQFVSGSFIAENKYTEGTCYAFDKDNTDQLQLGTTYYWRVTAYNDGTWQGYPGQGTDIGGAVFQFTAAPSETIQVPTLLYPPYYYPQIMPDTFEDRTMAVPTFMWDHVEGANSYELCIDDEEAMDCTSPSAIIVQTANASFTFTDTATYPLTDGQIYYWKVRAGVAGAPAWSGMNNKWKTRIDRTRVEITDTVQLIYPTYQVEGWTGGFKYGRESVTYYPVLVWTAVAPTGSATYEVQIARNSSFTDIVHTAQTDFTEYTPTERPDPGTYFWRVRQVAPSTGDWSEAGRFIVSRNFTWVDFDPAEITVDGDAADLVAAGVPYYAPAGETGDAGAPYDLTGFYIASDSLYWYLGVSLANAVKLGIYFDSDHLDGSGATAPPTGHGDDPNPPLAHQPEYAVYWASGSLPDGSVWEWNGTSWTNKGELSNISASSAYSSTTSFLEIAIPVANLSTFYHKGSLSLMMFTLNGSGEIQDRLPNQPGQPAVPAFLTESTVPTPLLPANAPSNPALATIEHNTPLLTWRHNEEGASSYFFKTYQDDTLTNLYESENGSSPKAGTFWDTYTHWAPQVHYSDNNSYNWTIKRSAFPESAPNHFRKAGYIPTNLQFSPLIVSGTVTYTNRTPSFSWQEAQSAPNYFWELFEGGQRKQYKETNLPYYTPQDAIADGTYTWKVWARDARNRDTAQAAQGVFTKDSDVVPIKSVEFTSRTLVLHWEPVDFAAYYRVEIADDPQFSRDFKFYTTYNASFTPREVPKATEDGSFYWRVYMYDNRNNPGPYIDLNIDVYPEKVYLPLVVK